MFRAEKTKRRGTLLVGCKTRVVSYFEHFCEDFVRRQGLNVSVAREPYVPPFAYGRN
jgi:hypothetical protein